MTSRERVHHAMRYQTVDKVPVRILKTPVGFYEHGEKLNELYQTLQSDFEPFKRMPIPTIGAHQLDKDGNYYERITDRWGVTREFRIYGIQGIPSHYLLNTPEEVAAYIPPAAPACDGPEFLEYVKSVQELHDQDYYVFGNGGSFYEQMIALYGDENVLCDLATDEPELHILADRIMENIAAHFERAIAAGVDGIRVGDDYGSEQTMIMSPDCWRRFFKPRWKELFKPIVDKGLDIHFHSCGQIMPILADLREIGVTSIWPQLPAYNMKELADYCRQLGLAVEVHTDRARTMTYGTPQQVEDLVKREFETFRMMDGGAWFYVEVDNGFPFENVEALVNTVNKLRG